jgi:hypothetical protein
MIENRSGIVQRAFELAGDVHPQTLQDIEKTLTREHYEAVGSHPSGASLRRELRGLIAQTCRSCVIPAAREHRQLENV